MGVSLIKVRRKEHVCGKENKFTFGHSLSKQDENQEIMLQELL